MKSVMGIATYVGAALFASLVDMALVSRLDKSSLNRWIQSLVRVLVSWGLLSLLLMLMGLRIG